MIRRTVILVTLAGFGCQTQRSNSNVWEFSGNDPEMRAAIDSARRTVAVLMARLQAPPRASQTYLSVKVRLGTDSVGEHIWLDGVQVAGTLLRGQLNEDAVAIEGAKAGQWVTVRPDSISDWMIIDSGVLCGGYTVRVERSRLSDADRARLDFGLLDLGLRSWATTNEC
jgi:uncharacterized protein YegJ (DUF2314 family)